MPLSRTSIDELRRRGLRLPDAPSFPTDHRAYPSGYLVMKPISVQGNSLPSLRRDYENGHSLDDTDTPVPVIWSASGRWHVSVWDWAPGPGPGDFVKEFASEAAAIHFIVQYFFCETLEFLARLAAENQSSPS